MTDSRIDIAKLRDRAADCVDSLHQLQETLEGLERVAGDVRSAGTEELLRDAHEMLNGLSIEELEVDLGDALDFERNAREEV